MQDYGSWPEKSIQITSLKLDSNNPRLPEVTSGRDQREIAAELLRHDNVYELARDIAEYGYFPTERLIGVDEDGEVVILEGNRRLAALKLLLSPEFGPDEYLKRFRSLQSRLPLDTIKRVKVVISPSREAAAPLIISKHTRLGVERWKPAQQAKFIAGLVGPGTSLEDVGKQFGLTVSEISKSLRLHTMYQVACGLKLPDDVAAAVRNPREFNASTLERLVENSNFGTVLGISFDNFGKATGKVSVDEFKKGYTRIISDIAREEIDTRSLNSSQEIESYLQKKLGKDKPNLKKKGTFSSDSLLGIATASPNTAKKPNKTTGAPRQNPYLIPSGFQCPSKSARILEIFRELKRLKVEEFPNACAVLLRIFAELLTSEYMDTSGKIKPLQAKADKEKKPADWSPTFRQMLRALLNDSSVQLPRLARKGLDKVVNDDNHPLSLDKLDQFVHNRFVGTTEAELRRIWDLLHPLFEYYRSEGMAQAK